MGGVFVGVVILLVLIVVILLVVCIFQRRKPQKYAMMSLSSTCFSLDGWYF